MSDADEVVAIMIVLLVDGEQTRFALLTADGRINRMGSRGGDAAPDTFDRDMFIGMADEDLFQQLRSRMTRGVNEFLGHHLTEANPVGKPCKLTVGVKYASGREAASIWSYGSESGAPNPEEVTFTMEAVRITDPWFQAQKAIARQSQA